MSITAEWLITDCALAAIVIEHRDNSAMIGSRVIPRRRRTVNTILPGEVVASAKQKGAEAASGSWRKRLAPENHQTQTMQLQPSKQIERGMVVEKPAEESVDLFIEDQTDQQRTPPAEISRRPRGTTVAVPSLHPPRFQI